MLPTQLHSVRAGISTESVPAGISSVPAGISPGKSPPLTPLRRATCSTTTTCTTLMQVRPTRVCIDVSLYMTHTGTGTDQETPIHVLVHSYDCTHVRTRQIIVKCNIYQSACLSSTLFKLCIAASQQIHVMMHMYLYVHTHTHVCMYIHIYTHLDTYMCIYI